MSYLYNLIVGFFNFFITIVPYTLNYIIAYFNSLYEVFKWYLYLLITTIFNNILYFFLSISRPQVFEYVDSHFCDQFSSLGYFAGQIEITAPLAIIMLAYNYRFVVRRIPFIG